MFSRDIIKNAVVRMETRKNNSRIEISLTTDFAMSDNTLKVIKETTQKYFWHLDAEKIVQILK